MAAQAPAIATISNEEYIRLYKGGLIPLKVCLASLIWVLHDYLVTLEDEVRYIWPQKRSFGRFMFLWIRYYTIGLVCFDVVQIHGFAIPGVTNNTLCVAADPTIRMVGGISLWSVEIIMQLRVYALYNRSRKVAAFNGILFTISIGLFLWIMIVNAMNRGRLIATAIHLPIPGCPAINGGTQWAQWIPAAAFELVLFGFVLYKAAILSSNSFKSTRCVTLQAVLLGENTIYFFIIASLLIFNNLMVVGATRIPWFGLAPFHAAVGIVTCRMLIHLRKFSIENLEGKFASSKFPELNTGTEGNFVNEGILRQRYESEDMDCCSSGDVESLAGSSDFHSISTVAIGEPGPSRLDHK
ncbi:unnamed protein product [Cyclocybe aegerita]|uniref:DUF6533 domain-containing protein n=1 Tax=Cyclocybe aegerita TaxID=1973307 RepID=A0A8S0XW64_CYCAE|nr:unnamed protein product [Cyclocybe aegerita]